MIQKKRTLRHFGIEEKGVYRGEIHEMHIQDIKDAIDANQIAAVIGEFGSGKSWLGDFAIQDLTTDQKAKYNFIHVDSADLEKLSVGSILECVVMDLGGTDEKPFRSILARSRQSRRILGDAVIAGYKNCLVIDNAHRLHPNVLMALKDEHEKKYMGRSPLFSVLYIGQKPLKRKLATYKEVLWRTLILDLEDDASGWMTFEERVNYLETVYGSAITPGARNRIAMWTKGPLHMEFMVTEKMAEAMPAGKETIDEEAIKLKPKQRREALEMSQKQVAEFANIGKSTVCEIEKGHPSTKKKQLEDALTELERKKYGEDDNSNVKTQKVAS